MKPIDILYTPLNVEPIPDFDLDKLYVWMQKNHEDAEKYRKSIITDENILGLNYPWFINHAYYNMDGNGPGWMNNFDKEFPDLSTHLSTALGIDLKDYGEILLLPIRDKHEGFGFWHQDPDFCGIRLYLEFENTEKNKLLMRRTIVPYDNRYMLTHNDYMNSDDFLEPELIDCQLHNNKQWFYINNDRAVHSTWTESKGSRRIAVIISSKKNNENIFIEKTKDLIVKSAEHFKEYAVYWDKKIPSNEKHLNKRIYCDNVKRMYK